MGAILPDASMFLFYGYQKFVGSTESDIWNTLYFTDHWQWFFDIFNSIPVFLLIAVLAYWRKQRMLFLVSASAFVHVLFDLPVHNDDAHRHFLPISNWRFISPVSYWDPKHFGVYTMCIEFLLSILASFYTAMPKFKRSIRVCSIFNLGLYIFAIAAIVCFLLLR